ncbi:hypothetical protein [Gimesia sp.]|uniref:hypothetical protein n=1 Tax=Gimesia sp. TaxID=2024833 RepID=UPI000C44F82D|nr:hypothetical protein [Gimesia sp.]MAX36058.1 hypothetical protein [Gimesia sp.]HAH44615.1 hypothetical protein [Planctomycetaceae bacterium]HBL46026.1 hypothetical protein [Planctomycetaceae bacterium]|tara:strand:- start:632 stop:1321 length:690 start_codon:yes stop_codon:yes gene_type:complete
MIIFNFGIPNSGTDWSQAVFQKIWQHQSFEFRSEKTNSMEELNQVIGSMDVEERLILQFDFLTQEAIAAAQQDAVRPFYHYRDPRDVVCAEMEYRDMTFADAVDQTVAAYQEIHHALCLPGIMVIPYEHLLGNAESLIFQMATKLGVLLKLADVAAIAEEMKDLLSGSPTVNSAQASSQALRIDAEHTEESAPVHSLHIGKWRERLSQSEQAMVTRFFKPLVTQFGYGE